MKKFKKDFLKEVLNLNNDEVELVMEAQRKFPSILDNDGKGLCLDGRTLHKELGVSKQFTEWIKVNLANVEAIKDEDYNVSFKGYVGVPTVTEVSIKNMSPQQRSFHGISEEYLLTLEIAKEICMVTGVNPNVTAELKNNSKLCRKYFILMEKVVRGLQEHQAIRDPEKENYNTMKEAILDDYKSRQKDVTKMDEEYLMKRECNMINTNLLGCSASDVRRKLGYIDRQTREHLEIEQNRVINYLQLMIIGLVGAKVEFEDRNIIIKNLCESKYSHLRLDN